MIDLGGTQSILSEAAAVVDGPRQREYGSPELNHQRTADLWTTYLRGKCGLEYNLTSEDVCFLNILQKVSRGINGITRDTLIDIAGYARNIEIIQDADRRAWKEYDIPPFECPHDEAGTCDCENLLAMREAEGHSRIQDY